MNKKLLVLYDAECVLCTTTVSSLRKIRSRADIEFMPLQQADPTLLQGFKTEEMLAQLHVIDETGRVFKGADAVVEMMKTVKGVGWLSALYRIPGLKRIADRVYQWIARNRYQWFGRVEDCPSGKCVLPSKKDNN